MHAPDRADTAIADTAVELNCVVKLYRQRLRGPGLGEALRRLVRPEIRDVRALDGVSFRVARGEILAYAGPNGAGKSTTVKLLSGLLAPDGGTVRLLGADPVRDRVRNARVIGVVFGQRQELWWDHPVGASFEWKRVVWGVPRDRYEHMVGFLRDLLGLDEIWRQAARELSLGQKMRAELGMALLHEPRVLLLDEPTIGLDVLAKRNLLRAIIQLNTERGTTVVVTSHDMADLEQLAARIVMIDRGRIAFDGSFPELRRLVSSHRRLVVRGAPQATLTGAKLLESRDGEHVYEFDPSTTPVSRLIAQLPADADVETHRPDIDDVVATLYEDWSRR